jgi:hypothetical protein
MTDGKAGRHPIWNLTRAGQKALADGNELATPTEGRHRREGSPSRIRPARRRGDTFPRLHVVLAGKAEHLLDNRLQVLTADVQGIAVAVWVNTLPRLQRGEPWYEIGVDDPDRRRRCYLEPTGR